MPHFDSIEAHGHSWGSSFGLSSSRYGILETLARLHDVTLANGSQSGGMAPATAADGGLAKLLQSASFQPSLSSGPYSSFGGLKVVMLASNEHANYGDTAGTRALTERALALTFSWLRAARVIGAGDANITYGQARNAAADTTVSWGAGYDYFTTTGDYIDIALDADYAGEAISVLVPHLVASSITGTWTATIDPSGANTTVGTYDASTFDATLKTATRSACVGFRIPPDTIPAGAQTLRLTASSLPGDFSAFLTFTALVIEGTATLVHPLYPPHPTITTYHDAFEWANARITAAIADFSNAQTVDLTTALAAESSWVDSAHPNEEGSALVASAILDAVAPESVVLQAGTGTALTLTDDTAGYCVVDHAYPAPSPRAVFASSADTEGSRFLSVEYENREVTLTVETLTEAALVSLTATVAHIGREGGTLTWTTPTGTVIHFDLLTWQSYEPAFEVQYSIGQVSRVSVRFAAKPFGRGQEVALTDHTETAAPALVFTEADIPGDVPALGRLVIDEDQAADQAWVIWGQRSRRYSADASAALLIKAEDMTTQGGSSKTTGATGAYGTNVIRNTDLSPSFVAVLSGQLSATSTYLSHVGTYRVFARVYCPTGNTGTVNLALEWAEGDFMRATRNTVQEFEAEWEGSWRLFDLGLASPREVVRGTQRWEPRIIAKSTVTGDEIDVDWLMFVPADEGAGEAVATSVTSTPSTFAAIDVFAQTAGALNGKTATQGGTWATSGSTGDLQVSGSGNVTRATTSDSASGGRLAIVGATNYTDSSARIDLTTSAHRAGARAGVVMRWVDASNYLACYIYQLSNEAHFEVEKTVAGTSTRIGFSSFVDSDLSSSATYRVQCSVTAAGTWVASVGLTSAFSTVINGSDSALATGGALASGKPGFFDRDAGLAATRTYDNFYAWEPASDAAVFASQSLEVRHDGAFRENSSGALWTTVSSYEGDHLLVPPSGPENRTVEMIVKPSRNVPGQGADSAIDDLSAQLHVTPRWLVVPS